MKILVPVKRVIDPYVPVRLDAGEMDVVREAMPHALNPFDEVALAKAASLRQAQQANELVAVSIGPAEAADSLRMALAIGADRAIHLVAADSQRLLPVEVATALQAIVEQEQPDLVLMGKQAVDDDAAQTAPLLAGMCNRTYVPDIFTLELQASSALVRYELNGMVIIARAALPAIASCELHLFEPRPIGLKQKMEAKRKSIDSRPLERAERPTGAPLRRRLRQPDERPPCRMIESPEELVAQLQRDGVLS